MSADWSGLEKLTEQVAYWTAVHEFLIAHTQTGKPDAPLFGAPYLDGARLVFPDHPRNGPASGDAWAWFSVIREQDKYSLVSSGFSRGNTHTDVRLFSSSHFAYTAKYFLFRYVGSRVRRANSLAVNLDPANWQFLRRGLASGWESTPLEQSSLSPNLTTSYRHIEAPDQFSYVGGPTETAASFYVDLPWHEISRLCANGIPGINHIPIPDESKPE